MGDYWELGNCSIPAESCFECIIMIVLNVILQLSFQLDD
ncbi:hypothetical protein PAU_03926 [Photorhabdus asymbiotica]|uniref:Uncharacterized protein n=1 Tax=Photorhabdus asymbiotica subsp. asymbiotica (strain ATCC 43949 / 3105-77) TaxID=553480 RepID=C7BNF9_PHOAA|nr:hypothetical protein PAU_03926 [Photorhabdus asymbiotica]